VSDDDKVEPIKKAAVNSNSGFPANFPVIVQMDPLGGHFQLKIHTGAMMALISRLRAVNEMTDEGKKDAARLLGEFVIDCQPCMVLRPYTEPEKSGTIRKDHAFEDTMRKMGGQAGIESKLRKLDKKEGDDA
jgi:hypothetical protein